MLCDRPVAPLSEFDQKVYRSVVPDDHYLRIVLRVVPWDNFYNPTGERSLRNAIGQGERIEQEMPETKKELGE